MKIIFLGLSIETDKKASQPHKKHNTRNAAAEKEKKTHLKAKKLQILYWTC